MAALEPFACLGSCELTHSRENLFCSVSLQGSSQGADVHVPSRLKSALLEGSHDFPGEFGLSSGVHWLGFFLELGVVSIASKGSELEITICFDEATSESSTVILDKACHGGRIVTSCCNPAFDELSPGRAMGNTIKTALSFLKFINRLSWG